MPRIYIPPSRVVTPAPSESPPARSPSQSPNRRTLVSASPSNQPSPSPSPARSPRQRETSAASPVRPVASVSRPVAPPAKPATPVYRQPASRSLFARIPQAIHRRSIQSVEFSYDEPPRGFRVIENDYHLYNDCTTSEASSSLSVRSERHNVPRSPSPVEPLPVLSQDDHSTPVMSLADEEQQDETKEETLNDSLAEAPLHIESDSFISQQHSELGESQVKSIEACTQSINQSIETQSVTNNGLACNSVSPTSDQAVEPESETAAFMDISQDPVVNTLEDASDEAETDELTRSLDAADIVSEDISLDASAKAIIMPYEPIDDDFTLPSHSLHQNTDTNEAVAEGSVTLSNESDNQDYSSRANTVVSHVALNDGGEPVAHPAVSNDQDPSLVPTSPNTDSHQRHIDQSHQTRELEHVTEPDHNIVSNQQEELDFDDAPLSSLLHQHQWANDSLSPDGDRNTSISDMSADSPLASPNALSNEEDSVNTASDSQLHDNMTSPDESVERSRVATISEHLDDVTDSTAESIASSDILTNSTASSAVQPSSDDDQGISNIRKRIRIRRIASDDEGDPIVQTQSVEPEKKRVRLTKSLLNFPSKPAITAVTKTKHKPTPVPITNKRKAKTVEKYSLSSSDEQYSLSSESEAEPQEDSEQRPVKSTQSRTRAQKLSALTGISSVTNQPLSRVFHRISLLRTSTPQTIPLLAPATQLLSDWDEITSFIVQQLQIHQLSFTSLIQYSLEDLTGILETYKQSTGSETLSAIASDTNRMIISPVYFLYLLRLCLDSLLNCGISVASTHWNFIRRGQTASMLYTLSKNVAPPKQVSDIPRFSSLMDRVTKRLSSSDYLVRHDFEHAQDNSAAYHLAELVEALRKAAEEKEIENPRVLIIASNHVAAHTEFIKQAWHAQAVDTTGKLWLWKKKRKHASSVSKWFESSSAVLVCSNLLETQIDLVPWDQIYDVVMWSSAIVESELSEETQQKLLQHTHIKFHHFVVRPEPKAATEDNDLPRELASWAADSTIESKLAEIDGLTAIPRGTGPSRVFMLNADACLMAVSWTDLAAATAVNQRAMMDDWIAEINSCAWFSNHCYFILMDVPLIVLAHRQYEHLFAELHLKRVIDSNPIQKFTLLTLPFEPLHSPARFNHLEVTVMSLLTQQTRQIEPVPLDNVVEAQAAMSALRCMNPCRSRIFSSLKEMCSLSLTQLAQRLNKEVTDPTVKAIYNELHADFRLS